MHGVSVDLEEAVEKAKEFLSKAGYPISKLLSAKLENDVWIMRFDVGILEKEIVTIKVDDRTGKVVGFEGPEQIVRKQVTRIP